MCLQFPQFPSFSSSSVFYYFSLTELSGVPRPPLFGLPILWTAYLLHLTWSSHIWPFMAIWPIRVFFECALRVRCVVWWGICIWVEMMLFVVKLGWMDNSSRAGEHWKPRINMVVVVLIATAWVWNGKGETQGASVSSSNSVINYCFLKWTLNGQFWGTLIFTAGVVEWPDLCPWRFIIRN